MLEELGALCDVLSVQRQAMTAGVAVPGFSASLGYFDTYRRASVPANLVQVPNLFHHVNFLSSTHLLLPSERQADHVICLSITPSVHAFLSSTDLLLPSVRQADHVICQSITPSVHAFILPLD